MRVSSSQIFSISNIGMRDAQASVNKTSQQISTGQRVLSPADDPVAATGILNLNQELSRLSQFKNNINTAENSLNLEDTTLQSIVGIVQRLKELAVYSGNTAVLTPSDYKAIVAEVDSRTQELVNLMNTQNSSGQYIFAGYQSGNPAYKEDGAGKYVYQGDDGQLKLQLSTSVSVATSDSGKKIFENIFSSFNTFETKASPTNHTYPGANISVGDVVDQNIYDKFYPQDLKITFNPTSAVVPAAANYTITEKNTGRILAANQLYTSGEPITYEGMQFSIQGTPYAGKAATPATLPLDPLYFGTLAAADRDFSTTQGTFDVTVGGVTESFVLDQAFVSNSGIASPDDLVTAMGGYVGPIPDPDTYYSSIPGTAAANNYAKLKNLGLTFTASGFASASGAQITVKNGNPAVGTPNLDTFFGFSVTSTGTTSSDGVAAEPGDSFYVDSSNKQSLLTTITRFSEALKSVDTSQASKDQLAKVVARTIGNLEGSITNISSVQGEVGARQNLLESALNLNSDVELTSKEVLSQLQDLDYAEASTRLQMQTMVLSAAQQTFIRVSELSLFKYM